MPELALRQELADRAIVGLGARAFAGSVRVIVLGERPKARGVSKTGKRVQTGSSQRDRGVEGDESRDQELARSSCHGDESWRAARTHRIGPSLASVQVSMKAKPVVNRPPLGISNIESLGTSLPLVDSLSATDDPYEPEYNGPSMRYAGARCGLSACGSRGSRYGR
jgi:hypothetical protein